MTNIQKLQVGNEGRMTFAFRNMLSFHIAIVQDLGQIFSALLLSGVDVLRHVEIQSAYVIRNDRDPIIQVSRRVGHDKSLILRPARQGSWGV